MITSAMKDGGQIYGKMQGEDTIKEMAKITLKKESNTRVHKNGNVKHYKFNWKGRVTS